MLKLLLYVEPVCLLANCEDALAHCWVWLAIRF
jgi:hypothetical protein